jgi:hypothetical protein
VALRAVWQMIERFFSYNNGARFIAYDGTGETVQLTWAKQLDLWKITGMKYTINGHGHLGAPATEATLDEVTAYIDGILAASAEHGRRRALKETTLATLKMAPRRRVQSSPKYGNLNPAATSLPTPLPATNAESVQMVWDRYNIIEHISMYSWLADETRVYDIKGFSWGDLWADNGTFCIYPSKASFVLPVMDTDYVEGTTFNGRPFVGVPCAAPAVSGLTSCSPGLGEYTTTCMQNMIHTTFGFDSQMQRRSQQTRHTLSNLIFLEQKATTAKTQVVNTLERFINGVTYDGSWTYYQHWWVKQAGVWKFAKINTANVGDGHLGGSPKPIDWGNFMAGIQQYPGAPSPVNGLPMPPAQGPTSVTGSYPGSGAMTVGRPVYATSPYPPVTVAPKIELNPLVSRIPYAAAQPLAALRPWRDSRAPLPPPCTPTHVCRAVALLVRHRH